MRIAALNKIAVKFAYPRLLEALVETMIACREYTTFEVSIILTNCEEWKRFTRQILHEPFPV